MTEPKIHRKTNQALDLTEVVSPKIEVLLVTKGHAFDRESFFQMVDALQTTLPDTFLHFTHVEHPAAEAVLTPDAAVKFDAILFYDMPGVTFTQSNPPFALYDPSDTYKRNFLDLLDIGKPMVFLHHAIAAWPSWPEFAELLGGRFHFLPGEFQGKQYPGSGYRFRVPQTITVLDTEHPMVQGIEPTFSIVDETYLMPVAEHEVTPLLRSDFGFEAENFRYGGIGFQDHPTGSNLVAWTKRARQSQVAYLQFGHEPTAYNDPNIRRLIANAIRWSVEANQPADHTWGNTRQTAKVPR